MFLANKYTKWYYNIITHASNRTVCGYVEKHHIVPKALGGTNDKSNIVSLTAREHFICHRLLTKMTVGKHKQKMLHAVWAFNRTSTNQVRTKISSRTYETIRMEFATMLSMTRKGVMNKGRCLTDDQRLKISRSTKGIPKSEATKAKMKESWQHRPQRSKEHCAALSRAQLGKVVSDETCQRMSASKKGINPVHTLVPFTCEHCGKQGVGSGNYSRWHGDNCRNKTL